MAKAKRKARPKPAAKRSPTPSTTAMVVRPTSEKPWELNEEQITILKNSIAKGASDQELQFCLTVARRYRLDPFKQQIWFVSRWDKNADNGNGGKGAHVWTPQVGIGGLLFAAARDHRQDFGSVKRPVFGPMVKRTWGNGSSLMAPEWAVVQVWKKGASEPTEAEAWWEEYAPADLDKAPFWRKMPRRMIGKCATALAIREAYPDLGGLYIPEECERIQEDYTPSGRQIVYPGQEDLPHGGSHEAAQAVAAAKIAEHNKTLAAGTPKEDKAGPMNAPVEKRKPEAAKEYQGTVELDWTDETKPIVRGDIANLTPLIEKHCDAKWDGEWWRIPPAKAEVLRQMCDQLSFRLTEVMPKASSAETKPSRPGPSPSAGKPETGTAKGRTSSEAPTPSLVSGTIQHFTEKMTKGSAKRPSQPYLNVLLKTEHGDRWYSVFDRDLFEFLSKGKGKQGEFFVEQNGDFWNLKGIKTLGGKEFEDGKVPVVQNRDREAGSGKLW